MSLINDMKPYTYNPLTPDELKTILLDMIRSSPKREFVIHTGYYDMWAFEFTMMGIGNFQGKYYITEFKKIKTIYVSLFKKDGNWKVKIKDAKLYLYHGTVLNQTFKNTEELYKWLRKKHIN